MSSHVTALPAPQTDAAADTVVMTQVGWLDATEQAALVRAGQSAERYSEPHSPKPSAPSHSTASGVTTVYGLAVRQVRRRERGRAFA